MTEWRTLDWLPGYEISDTGDVRTTMARRTRSKGYMFKGALVGGYRAYMLTTPIGQRILKAHRLVCEAFHGPAPSDAHQVAHGDGNSQNNAASNLRWATAQENSQDRSLHGSLHGERNGRAVLSDAQVRQIRTRYTGRYGQLSSLAREYGVGPSQIHRICTGQARLMPDCQKAADRLIEVVLPLSSAGQAA